MAELKISRSCFRPSRFKNRYSTIVPSLFPALSILESSDLVVTLPKRVAEDNGKKFDIVHRTLPIEGGEFQIHAVRHVRDATSPLHVWLLKILRELVTQ